MAFKMVPLNTTTGRLPRGNVPSPTTTRWRSSSNMRDWWDAYAAAAPPQSDIVENSSGQYALSQTTTWAFDGPPEEWLEGGTFAWDVDGSYKEYINAYHSGGDILIDVEAGPFEPGKLVNSKIKVNGTTQKSVSMFGTGQRQTVPFDNSPVSVPLTLEGLPPVVEVESVDEDFSPVAKIGQYHNGLPNPKQLHYSYQEIPGTSRYWDQGNQGDFTNFRSKGYVLEDDIIFAPGKPEPTNLARIPGVGRGGIESSFVDSGHKAVGSFWGVLKIEMVSNLGAFADLAIRQDHGAQNLQIYVSVDGGPLQFWRGVTRTESVNKTRYRAGSGGQLIEEPAVKMTNRIVTLEKIGNGTTTYYVVSGAPKLTPTTFVQPQIPNPRPSWGSFVEEGYEYFEVPGRGLRWFTRGWSGRGWGFKYENGLVTAEVRART